MEKKQLSCKPALRRRISAFCKECFGSYQDCLAPACPFYGLRSQSRMEPIEWWQLKSTQWEEASFVAHTKRTLMDGENVFERMLAAREKNLERLRDINSPDRTKAQNLANESLDYDNIDDDDILDIDMPDIDEENEEKEGKEEEKDEIKEAVKEEIILDEKKPKKPPKKAPEPKVTRKRGRPPRAKAAESKIKRPKTTKPKEAKAKRPKTTKPKAASKSKKRNNDQPVTDV